MECLQTHIYVGESLAAGDSYGGEEGEDDEDCKDVQDDEDFQDVQDDEAVQDGWCWV